MIFRHLPHYLNIAWRNAKKNRISTIHSLAGLAAAFALCLVTLLMVWDAMRSDAFFETADNLYVLERHMVNEAMGLDSYSVTSNGPLQPLLDDQLAGVDEVFRVYLGEAQTEGNGEYAYQLDMFLRVDDGFARAFPFEELYGDIEASLSEPGGLVLAAETATALYGAENPVGEVIDLTIGDRTISYTVGAVLAPLQPNTHFEFSAIALLNEGEFDPEDCFLFEWSCTGRVVNYMLLHDGADIATINQQIEVIRARAMPTMPSGSIVRFEPFPLVGLKWFARTPWGFYTDNADKQAITGVALTALILLISAFINHANISAALAMTRGREAAVRKALGASKGQLRVQYFGESVLSVLIAYGLSLLLAHWAAPLITAMASTSLEIFSGEYWGEILVGALIAVFVGLLAGIYPVYIQNRNDISKQLQMNQSGVSGGRMFAQNTLVLLQVAGGIGLVLATLSIYNQIEFMQTIDKGFEYEGVLHIPVSSLAEPSQRRAMQDEIDRLPDIVESTRSLNPPFINSEWSTSFIDRQSGRQYEMNYLGIDDRFFDFYDVAPIAGRLLDADIAMDLVGIVKDEGRYVEGNRVVNMSALREIGIEDPQNAIGQLFGNDATFGEDRYLRIYTIVGVVPDLNYMGGRSMTRPFVYALDDQNVRYLSVRFSTGNLSALLSDMEGVWKKFIVDRPFEYNFADEDLVQAYEQERATANLLLVITVASVLLGIAGLYGLSRHTVERRKKEITMRRVLGAANGDVLKLLYLQLAKPIVGGLVIGLGLALWWVNSWLAEFEYSLPPGVELIAALALMVVLVAGLTTTGHALRAVRLRPAEILRDE